MVWTQFILSLQERLREIEQAGMAAMIADKKQVEKKKKAIKQAEKRQDEPVDDSKLVDAMFDFLPDNSSQDGVPVPPSVFKVGSILTTLNIFIHIILAQTQWEVMRQGETEILHK